MRRVLALFSFLAVAGLAASAQALPITAGSGPLTLKFNGFIGGQGLIDDVGAAATLSNFSFLGNSVTFDVQLTNTTVSPYSARLTALGMDVAPTITGASIVDADGAWDYYNLNRNFPNGIGTLDFCATANSSNCTGGGSGLANGATATFVVTLNFSNTVSTIDLANFAVRYQSVSGPNFQGASGTGTPEDPGDPVPEPATLVLLGAGLLGAGALRRR